MIKTQSLPYTADLYPYFNAFADLPHAIFFDSGSHAQSGYSFFSALPTQQIIHNGKEWQFTNHVGEKKRLCFDEVIQTLNDTPKAELELPFCGGWMGQAQYELTYLLQPTLFKTIEPQTLPFFAGYYNWAIVSDHKNDQTYFVYQSSIEKTVKKMILQNLNKPPLREFFLDGHFKKQVCKAEYEFALTQIQNHLEAGDCYQINYTYPFTAHFQGEPIEAYRILREAVPSPFMGFYHNNDFDVLSISPERFIQVQDRTVFTQPIKGTAPRDKINPDKDEKNAKDLKSSIKNRAENTMIVDLLRNDLAKHCEAGSIHVSNLCALQSFDNVHHLVSDIYGTLKPTHTVWDLFFSAFPGGSITGAPKVRACQIIQSLEPLPRGFYCGSLFYCSDNGRFDSNIGIRSLVCKNHEITASVGGGIVADSNTADEYQECEHKLRRFLDVLEKMSNLL